jgi:hypothetical protein
MNITSAQYIADITFNKVTCIKATIDGEELLIPLDPSNRHYATIVEWAKEDGNTIEEAD